MASNPPEKRRKITRKARNPTRFNPFPTTLSEDVIEHIISYLPVKEASQTSILSKRFENSWQHSKHLDFDSQLSRRFDFVYVVKLIHRVMDLHLAPKIDTFHLCISTHNVEHLVYAWIEKALAKNPHSVVLDFFVGRVNVPPLRVPFEHLDIESIHTLKFSYCNLTYMPSKFQGLHFLKTLTLRFIRLVHSIIDSIINNCLLLEFLDIAECDNLRHLRFNASSLKHFKVLKIGDCFQLDQVNVNAPTLEVFHFVGKPHTLSFQGKLEEVRDVVLKFSPVFYAFPRQNMKHLMISLWHVRVLTINSTLLEDMGSNFVYGNEEQGPSHYLWLLKELQLLMEGASLCNPYDVVRFVDKCPALERLFIDFQKFCFDENNPFWKLQDGPKFEGYVKEHPFLKMVKFTNFNFDVMEMKLVKFFLNKSPNLENFSLFTVKRFRIQRDYSAIFFQHLLSWRSSPTTKVGVYEHNDKEAHVVVPQQKDYTWF